ncbi:MAG: 4-hydroxyphenylacetate decarboxylase activase [Sphaerochaetaceae bacterium]|nr:4-hydroxyphenylacetate decarboxylase activase [Sphaerochaetaceae bacterium]
MQKMQRENVGIIFDIQSYSVHDGPGCRTNVFFSGCPLRCRWCANPESWQVKKHLMFAERSCKWEQGCTACRNSCPNNSISFDKNGKPHIDRNICNSCETVECESFCASHALKQCVRFMTVDDVMDILMRDFPNWGSDGGVTFSGGEPLFHHHFLDSLLKRCRKAQMHTAIESSGFASPEVFEKIFRNLNFAFIDVKNMDNEMHKQGTGVSNEPILRNIETLAHADWWHGRLVLRQPTIHGYNDSLENAEHLIEFMNKNGLYEINLLRFHRLGQTKWEQLGRKYDYDDHGDMPEDRMLELQQLYLENDIACYIGENTPF